MSNHVENSFKLLWPFQNVQTLTSNFKWNIFSNFVAFSEYPNFNFSDEAKMQICKIGIKTAIILIEFSYSSKFHHYFQSFNPIGYQTWRYNSISWITISLEKSSSPIVYMGTSINDVPIFVQFLPNPPHAINFVILWVIKFSLTFDPFPITSFMNDPYIDFPFSFIFANVDVVESSFLLLRCRPFKPKLLEIMRFKTILNKTEKSFSPKGCKGCTAVHFFSNVR